MSEAYSFSLVCNEFDQFNELSKDWETDFRALSSSNTESIQLFQSYSGKTQLSHAHFELAVKQRALAPLDTRNIAILPPKHPDLFWCGKLITGGQVLLFNRSGEMESISKQGFEVFSLSVPESWLSEISATNPSLTIGPEEQVIQCTPSHIDQLYKKLSLLSATLRSQPSSEQPCYRLQDAILFEGLAALLGPADQYVYSIAQERQAKIMGDALNFIHTQRERITIAQICYHANTTERTLERIFRRVIGVSPKQYLNRFLLQEAKQHLMQASPNKTSVMSIAHKLGFSHMGQFAADYKTFFGELPSNTLSKC